MSVMQKQETQCQQRPLRKATDAMSFGPQASRRCSQHEEREKEGEHSGIDEAGAWEALCQNQFTTSKPGVPYSDLVWVQSYVVN